LTTARFYYFLIGIRYKDFPTFFNIIIFIHVTFSTIPSSFKIFDYLPVLVITYLRNVIQGFRTHVFGMHIIHQFDPLKPAAEINDHGLFKGIQMGLGSVL